MWKLCSVSTTKGRKAAWKTHLRDSRKEVLILLSSEEGLKTDTWVMKTTSSLVVALTEGQILSMRNSSMHFHALHYKFGLSSLSSQAAIGCATHDPTLISGLLQHAKTHCCTFLQLKHWGLWPSKSASSCSLWATGRKSLLVPAGHWLWLRASPCGSLEVWDSSG